MLDYARGLITVKVGVEMNNSVWPEEGLERANTCPVCGSSNRILLHSGLTDRVFFARPDLLEFITLRARK